MDGLVEGRVVHYTAYNLRNLAAIVIGVEDSRVDLAVFTNMQNAAGEKNFGTQFHQNVEYSEEPKPGTWHWIYPGQAGRNQAVREAEKPKSE